MSKRNTQRTRVERHRQERLEAEGERKLDAMQVKALDAVSEAVETVERKIGKDESRQPRFTSPAGIFSSVYRWALSSMANEPGARATNRQWDTWYRSFWKKEPFLAGVISGAVQIDSNRGWTMTGGERQVKLYTEIAHGFDDGEGWRSHINWLSQSFYTTGMGFVGETGRAGKAGPLIKMWSVDPCAVELTGNPDKPIRYLTNGAQEWTPDEFIRGKSLGSTDERQLGYGYPAVARCYDLAKILVGVLLHYQQKVGTKTPDAILTGKFIGETQWDEAVRARTEALQADPSSYLNSIATIMSSGGDMPEFALTLLSSLPDKFDIEEVVLIINRGYHSAVGYGAGEFYPESYGVIGRGKEQEQQHRSATSKGGGDFRLSHQEKFQSVLPPALEFQYEQRDVGGETEDAQLQLAKAQVITEMTKWTVNSQSVLTVQQIMSLAAEQGVVPDEWTPQDEDVTATDEEDALDDKDPTAILSERIQRALRTFPNERIVRYSWPSCKTRVLRTVARRSFYFPKGMRFNPNHEPAGSSEATAPSGPTLTDEEKVLVTWAIESNRGYLGLKDIAHHGWGSKTSRKLADAWERRGWLVKDASYGNRRKVSGALLEGFTPLDNMTRSVNEVVITYRDKLTRWVYEAMTGKMDAMDLRRAHRALIRSTAQDAYFEGMREGGIASPVDDATDKDYAAIKEWTTAQAGFADGFATDAAAVAGDATKRAAILSRLDMWCDSVSGLGNAGLLSAKSDRPAIWHLGETETHCTECERLDGKRHRVSWFLNRGYLPHTPPNATLGCDGWGKCFISDAVTGERIGV